MCASACVNVYVCVCLACECFVCAQDQDLFLRMLRLVVSRDSSLENGASVSRMEATSTETPFFAKCESYDEKLWCRDNYPNIFLA